MESWRLLDLNGLDPIETQMIYESVAIGRSEGLVPNTIIMCWPKSPLICIGYFQELDKEVDTDFSQEKGIPIVRRILGGGAVYLDENQLFYQVIVSKDNPRVPGSIEDFYRVFLQAPVKTYNDLGIPATYRPINDIQVKGRKISGNGAGETRNVLILTGNLILDFDYDTMARALKVPSEKFRDKLAKSLREWVSTVRRELGYIPPREKIKKILIKNYEKTLNIKLVSNELTGHERQIMNELRKKYQSREWLYMPSFRRPGLVKKRKVQITGDVFIAESMFKATGGLIRVTLEVVNGKIREILISGDFWFYPEEALGELEESLIGIEPDKESLARHVADFYKKRGIRAPGTTPEDFAQVIIKAATTPLH